MSDQSPLTVAGPHGSAAAADPVFTISGPVRAGLAASLLPDGFAPKSAEPPVFTISGPGHESRMRALEQRCEDLQVQIARLARD